MPFVLEARLKIKVYTVFAPTAHLRMSGNTSKLCTTSGFRSPRSLLGLLDNGRWDR